MDGVTVLLSGLVAILAAAAGYSWHIARKESVQGGVSITPSSPARPAPIPVAVPAIETLPRDRQLSVAEITAAAQYVLKTYGARVSVLQLVALAWVESSFRPWVQRYESHLGESSTGLTQVLPSTAMDLYQKGYKARGKPSVEALKNPITALYFGAAYLDWLQKGWAGRSEEWYFRAYNGGMGWERSTRGREMTADYWRKIQAAKERFA